MSLNQSEHQRQVILLLLLVTLCLPKISINCERVRILRVVGDAPISSSGSTLSIDVPQYELNDEDTTSNHSTSNNATYRQVSLASLTLQQPLLTQLQERQQQQAREIRQAAADLAIQANNGSSTEQATSNQVIGDSLSSTTTTTRTSKLIDNKPTFKPATGNIKNEGNWQELNLERIKPTWLNIGRQFKITDESINEVNQTIPAGATIAHKKLQSAMMPNSDYLLRPAFDSPILLRTKLGIIEGVRSVRFNKYLYSFLSVPYAQAPIGELRFKPPQSPKPWTGVYQATKWPPFCVQPSMTLASKSSPVHIMSQMMTEDCLYLNIWTPSLKLNKNFRRPVMVWLHGGAFQFGGVSVDENDGSALALLGDVVVVSLNYRISVFGFLNANNRANGPNNVGLLDQRQALRWVQENIKQFGGDPNQVTLFGESAGGHSVGLHMISPASWPLFRRAILQSGVPTSMLRSYDVNPDNAQGPLVGEGAIMVAKRLGCYPTSDPVDELSSTERSNATIANMTSTENDTTEESTEEDEVDENASSSSPSRQAIADDRPILSDEIIECLRDKSSLEILKAMGSSGSSGFFPTGNDLDGFFPNGPIATAFDPNDLKIGPQQDYLIGTNTDEGTFMLHYGLPGIFPAKDVPQVESVDQLREQIMSELDQNNRKRKQETTMSPLNSTSNSSPKSNRLTSVSASREELQSASGDNGGGAQGHLFKPLLRLKSNFLERFMKRGESDSGALNKSTGEKRAEFGRNIASLVSDIIFLCPSRTLARTLTEAKRNVHFYLYGHRSSVSQYHPWMGVTHHDEVEFIFGRPLRMADTYSGDDIDMSQRMIKIWSQFAHTGQVPKQHDLDWPVYGVDDNNFMRLDTRNATLGQRYHDSFCNLYETVISVHLRDN